MKPNRSNQRSNLVVGIWMPLTLMLLGVALVAPIDFGAAPDADKDLAQQIFDTMVQLPGNKPGNRLVHAKGIVCQGTFAPSKNAAESHKRDISMVPRYQSSFAFRITGLIRGSRISLQTQRHSEWRFDSSFRMARKLISSPFHTMAFPSAQGTSFSACKRPLWQRIPQSLTPGPSKCSSPHVPAL